MTEIATSSLSLCGGVPEVTEIVTVKLPVCAAVGVQEKIPAALKEAPEGKFAAEKVRLSPSASLAVAVKDKTVSASTLAAPIGFNTGAELTAVTVIVTYSIDSAPPLETA